MFSFLVVLKLLPTPIQRGGASRSHAGVSCSAAPLYVQHHKERHGFEDVNPIVPTPISEITLNVSRSPATDYLSASKFCSHSHTTL